MPKKNKNISQNSALMLVPRKSAWPALQHIRRHHDPAYAKWPPHITLFHGFQRDLEAAATDVAQVFKGRAPIMARFSKPVCMNTHGTVVLKPENCSETIRELHLRLCEVLPAYVRESWVTKHAEHSAAGKEGFIQLADEDFPAAHSEVFIPHLTVAQLETQDADAFVEQQSDMALEVELEVVLLRREKDGTLYLEHVFREGEMLHLEELYCVEEAQGSPAEAQDMAAAAEEAKGDGSVGSSEIRKHIAEPWLSHIVSGAKSHEGRIARGFWAKLAPGDRIEAYSERYSRVDLTVTEILHFDDFDAAFDALGKHLLPEGAQTPLEALAVYRAFNPED